MSSAVPPLVALFAAAGLAGCMVGPNYHRPSTPTPTAFKEGSNWRPAAPSDAADRKDWWTVLGDATLNDLEKRVEVSNQNLAAAEAAYREARAMVDEQRAALWPTVQLSASYQAQGGGAGALANNLGGVTTTGPSGGTSPQGSKKTSGTGTPASTPSSTAVQSVFRPGIGATWSPDIWGAVRRAIQNASATAQANAATVANARLSAQMELAQDYIELREFDEEKRLLDATAAAYAKTLQITKNKYAAGVVAKSDVDTAQAQLDSTRAQDVDLIQQRAIEEHAIAVLAGEPPADLTIAPAPWTLKLPQIPASVPSTLLERRPDIANAERLADAANAEIGVQVAAYYPTVTLTGQAGWEAGELAGLFSASNFFWSLGASAVETVFDAGLRKARVAAARAAYDQAVATYRQTTLTAFGQVEDNLAAQRVLIAEEALRRSASSSADEAEKITLNQYYAGIVDFTSVTVAEATALSDRTTLVQVQATQLTTAVDLIAALGGGWTTAELPKKP